jgi:hypothetical protein
MKNKIAILLGLMLLSTSMFGLDLYQNESEVNFRETRTNFKGTSGTFDGNLTVSGNLAVTGTTISGNEIIHPYTSDSLATFSLGATFNSTITLANGLTITNATDNYLIWAENSENLKWYFTTDAINVSSTTDVALVDFGTINLATDALDLSEGDIGNVGIIECDAIGADDAYVWMVSATNFGGAVVCSSTVNSIGTLTATALSIGVGAATVVNPSNILTFTETAFLFTGNHGISGTSWVNGIAYNGDQSIDSGAVSELSTLWVNGATYHGDAVTDSVSYTLVAGLATIGDSLHVKKTTILDGAVQHIGTFWNNGAVDFGDALVCSTTTKFIGTATFGTGAGTIIDLVADNIMTLTETTILLAGNGQCSGTWWNNGAVDFGDALVCSTTTKFIGTVTVGASAATLVNTANDLEITETNISLIGITDITGAFTTSGLITGSDSLHIKKTAIIDLGTSLMSTLWVNGIGYFGDAVTDSGAFSALSTIWGNGVASFGDAVNCSTTIFIGTTATLGVGACTFADPVAMLTITEDSIHLNTSNLKLMGDVLTGITVAGDSCSFIINGTTFWMFGAGTK